MKTRVFKMSNCSQYKPHARVCATAIYKYIQRVYLFSEKTAEKAKRRVDKREEMETSAFFFFFVFFFLIFQGK